MSPEFLKISPGHKIPAIVDHDGPGGATVTLCEYGAIFKYLGEKSGKFRSDVAGVSEDQSRSQDSGDRRSRRPRRRDRDALRIRRDLQISGREVRQIQI